ncbi:MAG: hypothetical protein ACK5G9_12060, partial [Akkermansiaceae bacterium]
HHSLFIIHYFPCSTQLRLHEETIRPIRRIKRIVGSLLDEFAFGDHEDLIGVADGGESVRSMLRMLRIVSWPRRS